MANGKIELKISSDEEDVGGDVAYISLPDHPGNVRGVACKQVCLKDLIRDYEGPVLYFDFDKENRLIGIEILT